MKRNDPLLLPICQFCGKYKGVGPCGNPSCEESESSGERPMKKKKKKEPACSLCDNDAVVSCSRCVQQFCSTHSKEEVEGKLMKWDQRIGTCTICKEKVCENCWILEDDGFITCLVHHEGHPHQD